MYFRCPNSGMINTMYIEFISPVQRIDPTEENKLENTIYAFFARTMSGYTIGFEENMEEIADNIRRDLITACNS